MTRNVLAVFGVILVLVIACAAGGALLFGGSGAACAPVLPSGGVSVPATGWAPIGRFDTEQVGDAAIITTVGAHQRVPIRGWIIAVATAIQESGLRNLPGGDQDSIGLFQQRPSQGWGTAQQLRDPAYQAGKFYNKLLTIPGWETLTLAQAAQAVQISAYPDAYAKHEPDATMLVNTIASAQRLANPNDLMPCATTCPSAAGTATGNCIDTVAVFGRAQSWLTAWSGGPVPYLFSGDPRTWYQGYRRDCSGYVSMALGLDGPGLDTSGLAAHSTIISKPALRPGDLLINTAPNLLGHVVLFESWTGESMTRYWGYEQSGDGGTHHRIIPFPYFGDYPMIPFRLRLGTIGGQ